MMKSRVVPALLVVNGVLVACILGVTMSRRSHAQETIRPADLRARGDYTMLSGKTQGGSNLIYIIDSSNQEVVALKYEQGKQVITGVGYRSIQTDGRAARGR